MQTFRGINPPFDILSGTTQLLKETNIIKHCKGAIMIHALEEAILNHTARIGVIGLGYVGLPLIRAFISVGFRTLGFDVDQTKVDKLLAGQSYIKHIPSQWIKENISSGHFEPTADMRGVLVAGGLLFWVGWGFCQNRDPDLTY